MEESKGKVCNKEQTGFAPIALTRDLLLFGEVMGYVLEKTKRDEVCHLLQPGCKNGPDVRLILKIRLGKREY